MYNPSAKAQESFRRQVEEMIYGVAYDDDDDTASENTKKNNDNDDANTLSQKTTTTRSSSLVLSRPLFPAEAALAVTLIMRLKRPLIHFRASKREGCTLKANAPSALTSLTRTDVDNLAKFVLDACNGLLYDDDRQIQSLHVIKQLDNHEQCLGSTQLLIKSIRESGVDDENANEENAMLQHALDPYLRPPSSVDK